MIVIRTQLKEVPKNCEKCKYRYHDSYIDRFDCKLLFWMLDSEFVDNVFKVDSIEAKKENCPIIELEEKC